MKNENQNIEDQELRKLAPTLFSIEKRNNFSIPDGYFDQLSDKLSQESSNKLNIDKKNNFTIPEGYFENLAGRIEEKINQDNTEKDKVISINRTRIIRFISVAASVAAILVLVFIFNKNTPTIDENLAQTEVNFEEITVEQFDEAIYSSTANELVDYIEYDDIQTDILEENDFNEVDLDITSSEIDDYLSSDYYFDVEY